MLGLFLLCFIGLCDSQGVEATANYILLFDSPIYLCGEGSNEYLDTSKIMVENYNESIAFINGELIVLKEMDNLIMELILKKEASGKLEVVASHDICDLCNEMGDEGSDYRPYLKYFELPTSCPFATGEYKINDFTVNMEEFDICDQNVGKYTAEVNIFKRTGENCKNDRDWMLTMKIDMTIERD